MFDWLKRKRRDGRARWSAVFNARQEERFEELVNARLAAQGESAVVLDGYVQVRGLSCGLDNLAQRCHALPPDDWPGAIEEHFDALRRSEHEEAEWDARKRDFDWVAPQLCVRLHVEQYTGTDGRPVAVEDLSLVRRDLPGIPTVLVADRPTTIASMGREVAESWGRTHEELFAIALANLARQHPVDVVPLELGAASGLRAFVLEGDHLFVASHALRVDAWPELVGAHGTIVAVPNRHVLIAYPVESAAVIEVMKTLAWLAHRAFADGPGSITPDLYWRTRDGRFERMQVEVEGKKIGLRPSPEFLERMNALTG